MARELRSVLDELDGWMSREHADLHSRFRPGLPESELEELTRALEPYHLPAELVELYGWRDGWDETAGGVYRPLLPEAQFGSLAETMMWYRLWLDTLGSDGWHPLWFPAFGSQSGELVTLQREPRLPAGQVYSFHPESDLETSYDSIAALFATGLDCWERGLLLDGSDHAEVRRVAAEHNPVSRLPDGAPRQEISRWSTADWPAAWTEAIAIAPEPPAAEDAFVTIADVLADHSSGRPVRAELTGLAGTGGAALATASDETGSLTVFLTRQATKNYRELAGGRRFELWLQALGDTAEGDDALAVLRGLANVTESAFLVTKLVPL